jgi:hypothetical protein
MLACQSRWTIDRQRIEFIRNILNDTKYGSVTLIAHFHIVTMWLILTCPFSLERL